MLLAYRVLTKVLALPMRGLLFFLAGINACSYSLSYFSSYLLSYILARGKDSFSPPLYWQRARGLCGIASKARTRAKPLLWLHGVDVGEARIALMLAQEIWQKRPHLAILLTTTSLPAANIVLNKRDERLQHQFAPLDCIVWWRRFLRHWQPTLAIRCENEFWPNCIIETAKHCPLLIVQARMSKRSFRIWQRASALARTVSDGIANRVMRNISLALCQDDDSSHHLKQLGVARTKVVGNLKSLPAPHTIDAKSESYLAHVLQRKTLWIAASTHKPEEEVVIEAHLHLLNFLPNALCVIAPRDLKRVATIRRRIERLASKHRAENCSTPYATPWQLRSHKPTHITAPFYILDSFGELTSIYRYAPAVFVGGSLTDKGGHNLFEPARHNCRILHGPYLRNTHAGLLHDLRLTKIIKNADDLSRQLRAALERKKSTGATVGARNSQRIIERHNKTMRANMLQCLEPYLTELDGRQ